MKLLNQNFKLAKASKEGGIGIQQFSLELLPHLMSGVNLCKFASKSCIKTCIVFSGNARFKKVLEYRKNRTEFYLNNRIEFLKQLDTEIKYYKNIFKKITIRLNTYSDIDWSLELLNGKNLFERNKKVQFLDYSKNPKAPYYNIDNYFVLFSGQEDNSHIWKKLLTDNKPVALVFYPNIPKTYKGYEVVDGDVDDYIIKFKDKGVIVGLKYKNMTGKGADNKAALLNNKLVIKLENYEKSI